MIDYSTGLLIWISAGLLFGIGFNGVISNKVNGPVLLGFSLYAVLSYQILFFELLGDRQDNSQSYELFGAATFVAFIVGSIGAAVARNKKEMSQSKRVVPAVSSDVSSVPIDAELRRRFLDPLRHIDPQEYHRQSVSISKRSLIVGGISGVATLLSLIAGLVEQANGGRSTDGSALILCIVVLVWALYSYIKKDKEIAAIERARLIWEHPELSGLRKASS